MTPLESHYEVGDRVGMVNVSIAVRATIVEVLNTPLAYPDGSFNERRYVVEFPGVGREVFYGFELCQLSAVERLAELDA